MFSWSFKRQLFFLAIPMFLVLTLFAVFFFKYVYVNPSCSDGVKNGDEKGVDCGGSCQLLCTSDTLKPLVYWAESFKVSGSIWNAGAYVENPNIYSEAKKALYVFRLYDEKNILITEVNGETFIPKNKKFLVFYPSIDTKGKVVRRTEFDFVGQIGWIKAQEKDVEVKVTHGALEGASTTPRISGVIENIGPIPTSNLEISAIIYNARGNVIGFSRTYTNTLALRSREVFGFTWPSPFVETEEVCEIPSDIMLVLDRSGSMASVSKTPPEPLTSVKDTANIFISSLKTDDRVGVVSFATEASTPVDHELSANTKSVAVAVDSIMIGTTTAQNTNIGDGLIKATNELLSSRARQGIKKVIVLLTDGDPTDPQIPGQNNYPTLFAEKASKDALEKDISIFTIGLGSLVNNDLLTRLASKPSFYFFAPTSAELSKIYTQITKSICTLKPNVIEIIVLEVE